MAALDEFRYTLANEQVGLWCDRCMLPTKIKFDVFVLCDGGVTVHTRGMEFCPECQGDDG